MMKRTSTFAQRLLSLRKELRLTLEEFSAMTGYPAQTLNKWEHGTHIPKVDAAAAVAEALGVSPLWLFGYDVPRDPEDTLQQKFEALDARGQDTVLHILNYEREHFPPEGPPKE